MSYRDRERQVNLERERKMREPRRSGAVIVRTIPSKNGNLKPQEEIVENPEEKKVVSEPTFIEKAIADLKERIDFFQNEILTEIRRLHDEPIIKVETEIVTRYVPCQIIKSGNRTVYKSLVGKKTFVSEDDLVKDEDGNVVTE